MDAEIRRLEQEEHAEEPELSARLAELYKLGQGRYLRMLLSVSDARRLGGAARMVAALARRDRDRLAAHERRRESLTASRTTLNERVVRLTALRADAEKARAAADRAVEDRNAIITGIDRQRDLNAQLAGELMGAQQTLQARLREIAGGPAAAEPTPFHSGVRNDLDWPVLDRRRRSATRRDRKGCPMDRDRGAEGTPPSRFTAATSLCRRLRRLRQSGDVDHGAQPSACLETCWRWPSPAGPVSSAVSPLVVDFL